MQNKLIFAVIMLPASFAALSADAPKPNWEAMGYGPFPAMTLNLGKESNGRDNSVLKAMLVRIDSSETPVYIAYDTETMRAACVWSGGFIDYKGVVFNGEHHAQPKPVGDIHFTTRPGPGWSLDGKFDDPRPDKRGPMPKELFRFKGVHSPHHIFSYSVGDCDILESPGGIFNHGSRGGTLTRQFHLSPTRNRLSLLVMDFDPRDYQPVRITQSGESNVYVERKTDPAIHTRIESQGLPDGALWKEEDGRVSLTLLPLEKPLSFQVSCSTAFVADGKYTGPGNFGVPDLSTLKPGGGWLGVKPCDTQGELGKGDGPYAVDTLTLPEVNPSNSWLRPTGFDFFADGKSAAVCTWSGEVWIVSGIDETLSKLTWHRFAAGLYQPLGLKIVDGTIYCTCRDRIVRLIDIDHDGEADFYESFNSDFILSYHFHEFMHDLQTDSDGNFYFAKGGTPGVGGPNFDVVTPHNGCFFKLSKDGAKLDIVARGLRAPNGIGVGPHGELTCGDNEGSWVPVCPINEVKPGGFLGVVPESWPGKPKPDKRDPPILWLPWHVDNSAGCQVWVTSKKWGPFENEMLHLSYGKSALFHVMTERVDGTMQGAVAKFPLQFGSGIMRARFNPADGQLYVCGMKGWQTNAARDGIFQRVRYTGKAVNMPAEFHVTATGVRIAFTAPLDKASAEDTDNYAAWWFNVKWTAAYGSDRWSPTDPKVRWSKAAVNPPGETLAIKSAKLSDDKKTVELEIPGLKPVTNMIVDMKIQAADGSKIVQEICNTINAMPK